jgi:hypothetical protein
VDEFTYKGRRVRIDVKPIAKGRRWDWSYTIDGRDYVRNSEELAPSREVAVSEARQHAEARIREMEAN